MLRFYCKTTFNFFSSFQINTFCINTLFLEFADFATFQTDTEILNRNSTFSLHRFVEFNGLLWRLIRATKWSWPRIITANIEMRLLLPQYVNEVLCNVFEIKRVYHEETRFITTSWLCVTLLYFDTCLLYTSDAADE